MANDLCLELNRCLRTDVMSVTSHACAQNFDGTEQDELWFKTCMRSTWTGLEDCWMSCFRRSHGVRHAG